MQAIGVEQRSPQVAQKGEGRTCPSLAAVSKSFSRPPRAALLCSRYAHEAWPQQHLRLRAMAWGMLLLAGALGHRRAGMRVCVGNGGARERIASFVGKAQDEASNEEGEARSPYW
jgi:hypothetical protein